MGVQLEDFLIALKEVLKEHTGAVLMCDEGVPLVRFERDELPDEKLMVVLKEFIQHGHEYWFDYYD